MTDFDPSGPPETWIRLPEPEEQRCRRYAAVRLALHLGEWLTLVAVLAALTLTGATHGLLALAQLPGAPRWLGHLCYLVQLGVIARLIVFPFHAAGDYWLERRYGLSRQEFRSWLWEWLARSSLSGVATLLLLFLIGETLRWWIWCALPWCFLFLAGRVLFFEYVYTPLLSHFYPVRFLRYETFTLPGVDRITLPVYLVQVSHKTRRANAGIRFQGRKAAIYVTDTLIDAFTDGEERVVIAHEFGHLYDRLHLENRTRAGVAQAQRKLMLGSAQLAAAIGGIGAMSLLAPRLGLAGVEDLAGLPLLAAITLILAHLFAPFLCAEARRDEEDADAYALAVTGGVASYVSVMRKLRQLNLEESCSHPISRLLFDTHPSYVERVRLALRHRRRSAARRRPPRWRVWRSAPRHGRR